MEDVSLVTLKLRAHIIVLDLKHTDATAELFSSLVSDLDHALRQLIESALLNV